MTKLSSLSSNRYPSHKNAVMALREKQIAASKREFRARGSNVVRCPDCLIAVESCICGNLQVAETDVAVCLVMYKTESLKPSNTGRLIADVIPENYAFCWHRTEPDPELIALLADPNYFPLVVFPADSVEPTRVVSNVEKPADKKLLLIFIDGTWREAKKMMRKSPYLDKFPVISIAPETLSEYKLRVAAFDHHLGTAEVAVHVLSQVGEQDAAHKLQTHFEDFREAYLDIKRRTKKVEMQ